MLLWYGYIYYVLIFFITSVLSSFVLKVSFTHSINYKKIVRYGLFLFSTFFLFFTLSILTTLYCVIDKCFTFSYVTTGTGLFNYLEESTNRQLINAKHLNISLAGVYALPFIYIFIFVTVLSLLFCLTYNVNEFITFSTYVVIILLAGYVLFFTDSMILFFFSYETLLVPSFFILYNFAKTRRCVEAAYLMFFWTQFGALWLIFVFIYIFFICNTSHFSVVGDFSFSPFEVDFIFVCLLLGFGVKLPIWPFYGWLPKAHVEASTNFSIFLSGVLVKFAFFGFLKCLLTIQLEPTFYFIYPFLTIGITDSVFKLFYQIDLKKLIAYSTVVEMHWLTLCIISGQSALILSGFCMLVSHALLSTNSFLLVDAIARRFKTRLITEVSGLNFICPKLFLLCLLNLLVYLGFPGSIMFIAEILFFTFLIDLFPLLYCFFIVLLYLLAPTFVLRTWMNILFGTSSYSYKTMPSDLSSKEFFTYGLLIAIMFWFGVS